MKLLSLTNSSFQAQIDDEDKVYSLGYSQDEKYLAKRYNEKTLELYGSTAKLNNLES